MVAINRLLAKWLFNPVQAYSALKQLEMQMKTKMKYDFLSLLGKDQAFDTILGSGGCWTALWRVGWESKLEQCLWRAN